MFDNRWKINKTKIIKIIFEFYASIIIWIKIKIYKKNIRKYKIKINLYHRKYFNKFIGIIIFIGLSATPYNNRLNEKKKNV